MGVEGERSRAGARASGVRESHGAHTQVRGDRECDQGGGGESLTVVLEVNFPSV